MSSISPAADETVGGHIQDYGFGRIGKIKRVVRLTKIKIIVKRESLYLRSITTGCRLVARAIYSHAVDRRNHI